MVQNIGIGFVTGRKHFQTVLKTYINTWLENGLIADENIRLHLFIAYDLKYFNTHIHDYKKIDPALATHIDSINIYGATAIKNEKQDLIRQGIIDKNEGELLFGEGYAKKRNAVLYFALKHKMDKLIFLDDDEYPIAAYQNTDNRLIWEGQSVVGTHIHTEGAGITHGHHCGYISPIPSLVFDKTLGENDFQDFIEAISNEVISWQIIRKTVIENKGVTYANPDILLKNTPYEITETNGLKVITGANLCFHFKNIPHIPPFYNPPNARGEDTFMSTLLSNTKVMKVPCYTFHDGFLTYKHLLNGVLPKALQPVDLASSANQKRFLKATIGWIRYKPLLLYITQRNYYAAIIEDIQIRLEKVISKFNAYFKTHEFDAVLTDLFYYHRNVKRHYAQFQATQVAWDKVLKSL